eukprot:9484883-Pyramimonas_sp.AAC.1
MSRGAGGNASEARRKGQRRKGEGSRRWGRECESERKKGTVVCCSGSGFSTRLVISTNIAWIFIGHPWLAALR